MCKKQTKKELYLEERLEILNKLNDILEITENNSIIYFYDVDNSTDKQQQIDNLINDIKKYLSLVRSIYQDMDYEIYPALISFLEIINKLQVKFILCRNQCLNLIDNYNNNNNNLYIGKSIASIY